ncbi:DNA primase [Candidatus Venteria ishoeyi]|uniref:DNA primase n=1 Tax=Candidatus Venteria ishoeyi TaxID=1899563 RepID=A0A1H6FGB2_9GAMM|nr:DNA primase [Candidatus Venteria ishoeyi]SEH08693.1 DNA primase [Candidatus Venteria ishoeyi]
MSGYIPKNFIESLIDRCDIITVVDSYVPLKKAGKDYHACCPFHQEKTPSFTVSAEKQFYHCFGCGANGNIVSFLMEYEHCDFVEAIEELAASQGLSVPYEKGTHTQASASQNTEDLKPLYQLLEQANRFYQTQLRQHPQAGEAIDYLKKRELSGQTAARFELGYAPDAWNELLTQLAGNSEQQKHLLDAGLIVQNEQQRYYDRFRNRIIFPIHDQRGRVIAFGGRVLDDSKPKYLNSPETPVFHKGKELYGLHHIRKQRNKPEQIILVEGYMDVVALAQHDIHNAAATLGTATSTEHLQRLYRLTEQLVFCFDGDEAGRKAAWKALETLLPLLSQGRQANFMFLPNGEDPDSLVRQQGKQGFYQQIEQALPLSQYLFSHLQQQLDISTLDGKARLLELAKPLIHKMPEGAYQDLLLQHLGEITGTRQTAQYQRTAPVQKTASANKPHKTTRPSPIRVAIALLLQSPEFATSLESIEILRQIEQPGLPLLVELIDFINNNPNIRTGTLVEHWRYSEHEKSIQKLANWDIGIPQTGMQAELQGAISRLIQQTKERQLETLLQKSQLQKLSQHEKQSLNRLLSELR